MARRMAGVGRVTVSLRRSMIMRGSDELLEDFIGQQHAAPCQPQACRRRLEQAGFDETVDGRREAAPLVRRRHARPRSGAGPRRTAPRPDRRASLRRRAAIRRARRARRIPGRFRVLPAQSRRRRNARRRRSRRTAPAASTSSCGSDSLPGPREVRDLVARACPARAEPFDGDFVELGDLRPRRARPRRRSATPPGSISRAEAAVLVHFEHVDGDVRRRRAARSSRAIRAKLSGLAGQARRSGRC